ncbi:MAG: sigma-54-dependent Fis family transcriptional regulator [Desulfarculus sp.]|nr:sigma-54-dependent Fis family transcriptional regulator [Desulfarculus sp.]
MDSHPGPNLAPGQPPSGWRPAVLVLDDEWSILERIRAELSGDFEVVTASRAQEAQELIASRAFDVVLTDLRMPDMDGLSLVRQMKARFPETQYILMTAFGDIEDIISALRLGVADYLRKPFTMGEVRHALNRCLEQRRLRREVASLRAAGPQGLSDIITRSRTMAEVVRLAQTVAATDVTVLLNGDTGTGKELLARAIHNSSPRRQQPFVEINCAAIPASLIESELFGHERGSFTGAHARKLGRVEMANQGTLFLDEVGEMSLDMQAKLLRFLQEFTFERVGGTKKQKADVRVVAATNRELKQAVAEGLFRQDLLYRLNVIHLDLPPLRQRPEDIPLLAEFFLQRFALKYGKQVMGLSPRAQDQLMSHDWPGNVRELEHVMERAVILCRSSQVQRLDLADAGPGAPVDLGQAPWPPAAPPQMEDLGLSLHEYLERWERRYLKALLQAHLGSIQDTARAAGLNPKTLYLKMTRHGLSKKDYRPVRTGGRGARPRAGKHGVS